MKLYIFDGVSDSLSQEVACYVPCTYANGRVVVFVEVFTDLPCDVQELLMSTKLTVVN